MSKKNKLWLVLGIFFTILLSGCKCNNLAVEDFVIFADSPALNLVVSTLNPTFSWTANKSCDPDEYDLYIREDVMYGGDSAYEDVIYDDVPYTLTGDSLLPGRAYYWYARAVNDYTSSEDPGAPGPFSDYAYFFTGPVCSGETLIAPELQFPRQYGGNPDTDNWITHNHLQQFKWTYTGGCLPVSYDFQFATDAGFTDIVLTGTTATPYFQKIFESFPNCSTLFWRVAANDGTTVGPWSETWNFHWVREGTDCYQTQFISDDAARIRVQVYDDVCIDTGFSPSSRSVMSPGCVTDGEPIIHADGEFTGLDSYIWDVVVNLGSGPCPSTGLDQKKFGWNFFYVLAPGSYCVSISRDQIARAWGSDMSLMKGIWTDPRTSGIIAEKTIEFGPGTSDIVVEFGLDYYDRIFIPFELTEPLNCRERPYTGCPLVEVPLAGITLPIMARDTNSEWKLSQVNGVPCYLWLENEKINQALMKYEGFDWRAEDLDFFVQPNPCPPPVSVACGSFENKNSCRAAGCTWYTPTVGGLPYCKH